MLDSLILLWHYLSARSPRRFPARSSLEAWQTRQFQHFAKRVLIKSPYYRPFVGQPLAHYPIISKSDFVGHFDDMNTVGARRNALVALALEAEKTRNFTPLYRGLAVGLSSGTSGQRGLFVTSRRERLAYAGVLLARALPHSILRRQRIALLLRADNALYQALGKSKRIEFRFFDLSHPLADILGGLQSFQPTTLAGPPQVLRLVAEAQQRGQIALGPHKIIAGAEVLDREDAQAIEAAFARPVHQIYQAMEGFLGITCPHGTLHLNEDHLIIEPEWVDRSTGRFLPIVTDFRRSTQPVIRYRLNDILTARKTPCPCGSGRLAIERIEGREDDILYLPGEDGTLQKLMPDYVRDAFADLDASPFDYRVIQHGVDRLEVRLDTTEYELLQIIARQAMLHLFHKFAVHAPTIVFHQGINANLMRKLRRVERRFDPEQEVTACATS